MQSLRSFRSFLIILVCLMTPLAVVAGDKNKDKSASTAANAGTPSYELPQPVKEEVDYAMYDRIRDEGLHHSHVMEFASALMDGIGPRLTGSPNLHRANEWTRDQLTAMGCVNAHLEDWGEFGMGWQQLNTWVRMSSPDTAVFIAQAAPWSPSTNGAVSGSAVSIEVKEAADLDKYKGKVAGKIVFYGEMREVKPVDKPLFERADEKDLAKVVEYPLSPNREFEQFIQERMKRRELEEKLVKFLADEHALAIVLPSRDGRNSGGSGGTIFDDGSFGPYTITGIMLCLFPWS